MDRRLYLVQEWFTEEAAARRRRAAVPAGLEFRTKLDLGAEMVWDAYAGGHLPCQWVTGDAAYGDSHDLRALVAELERWYCLEVSSTTNVWAADPAWAVPPRRGTHGGRLTTRQRPTPSSALTGESPSSSDPAPGAALPWRSPLASACLSCTSRATQALCGLLAPCPCKTPTGRPPVHDRCAHPSHPADRPLACPRE
ncbi:MAG TPA: transposase [Candidatus Saccharimonadales bacterium]|nr:transposase [Candidatus Saccharimonadales bacterium]